LTPNLCFFPEKLQTLAEPQGVGRGKIGIVEDDPFQELRSDGRDVSMTGDQVGQVQGQPLP